MIFFFILFFIRKNTSRVELFSRFEEGRNIFIEQFSVYSIDGHILYKLVRDRQKYKFNKIIKKNALSNDKL